LRRRRDRDADPQAGGIACHTGRESCFYRRFENGGWTIVDAVLKDPDAIYQHKH
jgi:phosphoribosyl-AMP cyclohydrolase